MIILKIKCSGPKCYDCLNKPFLILDVNEDGLRDQVEAHGSRKIRNNRLVHRDKIYMNNINKRFSEFEEKLKSQKEVLNSVQKIVDSFND